MSAEVLPTRRPPFPIKEDTMLKHVSTTIRVVALLAILSLNLAFAAPAKAVGHWDDDWCDDPEGSGDWVQCCTPCLWFCSCILIE